MKGLPAGAVIIDGHGGDSESLPFLYPPKAFSVRPETTEGGVNGWVLLVLRIRSSSLAAFSLGGGRRVCAAR